MANNTKQAYMSDVQFLLIVIAIIVGGFMLGLVGTYELDRREHHRGYNAETLLESKRWSGSSLTN